MSGHSRAARPLVPFLGELSRVTRHHTIHMVLATVAPWWAAQHVLRITPGYVWSLNPHAFLPRFTRTSRPKASPPNPKYLGR